MNFFPRYSSSECVQNFFDDTLPGKRIIIISYHYSIIIFYSAAARRQRVRKERNERGERERQPESERARESDEKTRTDIPANGPTFEAAAAVP